MAGAFLLHLKVPNTLRVTAVDVEGAGRGGDGGSVSPARCCIGCFAYYCGFGVRSGGVWYYGGVQEVL